MVKRKFNVTGMSCSSCSACVDGAVRQINGVKEVSVSLLTNSMIVDFDENLVNNDAIINAVIKSGFGASSMEEPKPAAPKSESENAVAASTGSKDKIRPAPYTRVPEADAYPRRELRRAHGFRRRPRRDILPA